MTLVKWMKRDAVIFSDCMTLFLFVNDTIGDDNIHAEQYCLAGDVYSKKTIQSGADLRQNITSRNYEKHV